MYIKRIAKAENKAEEIIAAGLEKAFKVASTF